jgi:hypothetical protein
METACPFHDADSQDDNFHRVEGFGIDQIFKGRAKQDVSDQEILAKAFERFDAVTHNSKGHEKFLDKRNSSRNAAKSDAPNPRPRQLFSPWRRPSTFGRAGGATG